jgi:regulatory protein
MAFGRGARRVEHRAAGADTVRAAALALLTRREYASTELVSALTRKGYPATVAKEVVAALAAEYLVDDARYAASLVRMLVGRGQGPLRISRQLREAGLGDDQITAALAEGPDWQGLAAEVRRRKFGADVPQEWPARARQMRFLQYRGFSGDHVTHALGQSDPQEMPSDLS